MSQHDGGNFSGLSEERVDRVKEVLVDVRRSFGVGWAGELFESIAPWDRYLQAAWYQLKPAAVSAYFQRLTAELEARALRAVIDSGMPISDHRRAMSATLGVAEAGRLSATLLALDAIMAPSLLVAIALRDVLLGREVGSSPPRTGPDAIVTQRETPPRLSFAGANQATGAEFVAGGVQSRAFNRLGGWLPYVDLARSELRHLVRSDAYRRAQTDIDVYVSAAIRALPFPFRASGDLAQSLGYSPAEVSALLDVVTGQQRRLCALCLQFGALRYGWEGGNLDETGGE